MAVSRRQDLSAVHVKIFGVPSSFPSLLQLVGFKDVSERIALRKPDTLIDGQRWVETVRSHEQCLPHRRMMIIGNTYLPFDFNDVPPLQERPRFKEVLVFVSAGFSVKLIKLWRDVWSRIAREKNPSLLSF